ncbi:hypothetical protein ACHQM5_026629 [Ranunculus cassubicifolius]
MSFFTLSDDLVLLIFSKLENDPHNWSRVACVCTKFSWLIRNVCWKNKCVKTTPSIVSDLVSSSSSVPPGGWSALHKLSVCCPGLHHAGVLLENSDFGLERELGPDENYHHCQRSDRDNSIAISSTEIQDYNNVITVNQDSGGWSLYDDLYFDTVYDVSEVDKETVELDEEVVMAGKEFPSPTKKRKTISNSTSTHVASGGVWNLCREQGNKLLASRFRGDSLYICDWPGCVHTEETRSYMLFRGIFKNFKKSQVWRTINDGNRSRIMLDCAFCECKETWDLHSAFCLKRVFGYHDNGEPVVRAYVCENGHVSGAWTDRPMYS